MFKGQSHQAAEISDKNCTTDDEQTVFKLDGLVGAMNEHVGVPSAVISRGTGMELQSHHGTYLVD